MWGTYLSYPTLDKEFIVTYVCILFPWASPPLIYIYIYIYTYIPLAPASLVSNCTHYREDIVINKELGGPPELASMIIKGTVPTCKTQWNIYQQFGTTHGCCQVVLLGVSQGNSTCTHASLAHIYPSARYLL